MAIKIKGLPEYGGQKVKASADVAPEKIDPNVAVSSIKAQGQAKADAIISKGEAIQSITGAVSTIGMGIIQAKDESKVSHMLTELSDASIENKKSMEQIRQQALADPTLDIEEATSAYTKEFTDKYNDEKFKEYKISPFGKKSAYIQYNDWRRKEALTNVDNIDKINVERRNYQSNALIEKGYQNELGYHIFSEPFTLVDSETNEKITYKDFKIKILSIRNNRIDNVFFRKNVK